jgi:hypothetical protein
MSLLLLFQGGVQADIPPPPPPPPVIAMDFLSHGAAVVGPGALGAIAEPGAQATVGVGASTHTTEAGAVAWVGPGGTTTIQ